MIKLSEIARVSGFSIPVVSRVLSPNPHKGARVADSTRSHILAVARRMNYRPNRSAEFLKRGKNPIIGCFLPCSEDSLVGKLMRGIAEEARRNNFPLAFYFDRTKKSYLEFIDQASQFRNCGIITYPYFKIDPEVEQVIAAYQSNGGKLVLIEGGSSSWQWNNCTAVSIDNYHGGRLAAEHLLLTRKARYFITQEYSNIPERTRGFVDSIEKHGGELRLISSPGEIIQAVRSLRADPVGIFIPRDQDAINLLCQLQNKQLPVGEKILLIGYDNQYTSEFTFPGLTSVEQPFGEIGKLAIRKLIAKIYDKEAKSTLVKPKLIVRGSA